MDSDGHIRMRRVGDVLEALRRRRMWTQARLAEEAGISPTTVSGIESGKISRPQFGTLGKLARVLGVDPQELVLRHGPAARQEPGPTPMSLEWAQATAEADFEQGLDEAPLEHLRSLAHQLDQERGRLQALYGEFQRGSEQRRYIKRQIRSVSAQSASVSTSIMFHRHLETGGSHPGSADGTPGVTSSDREDASEA